ncbi:MAG: CotH kinase family protein [Mariniblastus sp.]|nr:CotH kinase family protein [Mariniblastus sp.]
MILRIHYLAFSCLLSCFVCLPLAGQELSLDEIFPDDRVLRIEITVDEEDWESIRYVRRDLRTELAPERQFGPLDGPYEYVKADVVIDGVKFKKVGIRKKGLLGSQSAVRPSFKIKLNYKDKKQSIDGYSLLTLNNNRQDPSVLSQFMGYRFYHKVGLAAPRSALAHVTLNGKNFGVYTHVESAKKPLVKNGFGNSGGTLYEGTVNDFHPGWENSFDCKFGDDEAGKKQIKALIDALENLDGDTVSPADPEAALGAIVDLDEFYKFWAVESLLGFWDGYCGNRNNFFIYVNPDNDKISFVPWGGDCMFQKYSRVDRDRRLPLSVKTKGMLAYYLYRDENSRERYREALLDILAEQWDEGELLAEAERVRAMAGPYFNASQRDRSNTGSVLQFIRNRRDEIMEEIRDGMPEWDREPGPPAVITADSDWGRRAPEADDSEDIWLAAKAGNLQKVNELIEAGMAADQPNDDGTTPLIMAALGGQTEVARLLIEKGADVNAKANDGNTAIHSAAFLGHLGIVKLLVDNDVDLKVGNRSGEIPLQVASGSWDDVVEFTMRINDTLNLGLNLTESKENRGQVARYLQAPTEAQQQRDVWSAAKMGKLKLVSELLASGMLVDQRDSDGNTPLVMAAMAGKTEVARLLIEKGADVNARTNNGGTPLHGAAFMGHLGVVQLLVENDVDLAALNGNDETAWDVASFSWSRVRRAVERMNNSLDLGVELTESEAKRKRVAEYLQSRADESDR